MQNKIICVIAPKRSGKTRKVSTMVKDLPRVAVFDMMKDSQYMDDAAIIKGNPEDFAKCITPDRQEFRVVYHPTIIKLNEKGLIDSPSFEPILKLCHLRGEMYLVIDEAHLLCNSRNCPAELMMASYVGGHKGFSMILIAQSFTGIHPVIRRNADELILWRIIEPSDLEGIRERCGREVEDQVRQLRAVELDGNDEFVKPGQMLHWTKSKGVIEVTE